MKKSTKAAPKRKTAAKRPAKTVAAVKRAGTARRKAAKSAKSR